MNTKRRDMTKKEFIAACERHGFKSQNFLGYYRLPSGVEVSVCNIGLGSTRREQLAYLIQKDDEFQKRKESEQA